MRNWIGSTPIVAAVLATACTTAEPTTNDQSGQSTETSDLSASHHEAVTDEAGTVTVDIDVADARSFLVTVQSGNNTSLATLLAPDGETVVDGAFWYEQPYWYSEAITGGAVDATFNWPVRGQDGPLDSGTYRATFEVWDDDLAYLVDHPVGVTIHQNHDGDLTAGYLRVLVVWADGVDDDTEAAEGTKRAVARSAEIWQQAGISVDVSYAASNIDPDLTSPGEGDALVEAGELGDGNQMIVLVGDLVAGGGTLGEAGGIPGPLVATNHTGLVVGWLECAGTDGQFSDADVAVYGETLAHEMGHYLGLFHPFEQGDAADVVSAWDALDDTPSCSDGPQCEALLATNVMVPYTVYDDNDEPIPAHLLTPMQAAQMQHYTGVVGAPAATSEDGPVAPEAGQGAATSPRDHEASPPFGPTAFAEMVGRLPSGKRAELTRLRRHLASRDASAACPVGVRAQSYRQILDSVTAPACVPMRAARCLVEQAGPQAEPDLQAWLAGDRPGLQQLAERLIRRTR